MPALFDGSTGYLQAAAPVTAVPFSFGFRFRMPTSGGDYVLWSLTDASTDVQGWTLFKNGSNIMDWGAYTSGGYTTCLSANAIVSNEWHYGVWRAISATNRRQSILRTTGASDHSQSTTSRVPTGIDVLSIGAAIWFDAPDAFLPGRIEHYWFMAGDCQPGGAQLDEALLRVLAQDGPLAVPHIRNDPTLDYIPMVDSVNGGRGDYYSALKRPPPAINGSVLVST